MSNLSATRPQYNEQIGETTKGEGVSFSDPMNKFIDDLIDEIDVEQAGLTATNVRVTALEAVEAWHEVGSGGVEPAFQNSWVNFGATTNSAAFKKIGSVVYLKGLVKSGTSTIFTLPVGYRPAKFANHPTVDNGGGALVNITGAGVVSISNGVVGTTFVSLELSYPVE